MKKIICLIMLFVLCSFVSADYYLNLDFDNCSTYTNCGASCSNGDCNSWAIVTTPVVSGNASLHGDRTGSDNDRVKWFVTDDESTITLMVKHLDTGGQDEYWNIRLYDGAAIGGYFGVRTSGVGGPSNTNFAYYAGGAAWAAVPVAFANTWFNFTFVVNTSHIYWWINGTAAVSGVGSIDSLSAIEFSVDDRDSSIMTVDDLQIWSGGLNDKPIFTPILIDKNLTVNFTYPTFNGSIYQFNYTGYINATLYNVNGSAECNISNSEWVEVTTSPYGNETISFYNSGYNESENYTISIFCADDSDTYNSTIYFRVDEVDPIVSVNFVNNSIQSKNFTLEVDYYDEFLYRTNTTIRFQNETILYNNYSGDLGAATTNYTASFYLNLLNDTFNIGEYIYIDVNAADTHTIKEFKEKPKTTEIEIFNKKVKDYDMVYGDFMIEYPKTTEITEIYKNDRIQFKIKDTILKGKQSYKYIEADKIVYLDTSEYPCHMIINDKYWYDCVGMKNPKVTKERNNRYKIDFYMDSEEVITKSLGGLNEISKRFVFKIEKNFTGNINSGDFFNPPNSLFNYTSLYDFNVSSLYVNETCIKISGSNVSSYDGSYCYTVDTLELENVVLFSGTTPIDCYAVVNETISASIDIYTDWFNKTGNNIYSEGITTCIHGDYCTLSELPGSYTNFNDSATCRMTINDSWFIYQQYSNIINTSSIDACEAGSIYQYPIINISYRDETTGDLINATGSYNIYFYNATTGTNFNLQHNNSGVYTAFCTDSNTDLNLLLYGDIILSSSGYITRAFDIPLSNSYTVTTNPYLNYSLYLILIGNSSTISYTWQTTTFEAIDGTMLIYRCNEDNTKTLIESTPIASGSATANLQLFSTAYSYSVIIDGTTYQESSYYDCHVESTATKTYYVDTSTLQILPVIGLFMIDCNIEKTTPTTVKMTWSENTEDPDTVEACLLGYRETIYNYTKVYESCINTTSGSMTRNVALTGFNYKIKGEIRQNGNVGYCQDEVIFSQRTDTSESLGATGAFAVMLLVFSCAFLFAGEGVLAIGGAIIGVIIAWLLGILSMSWYSITSIIMFGLIIALVGRYARKRQ